MAPDDTLAQAADEAESAVLIECRNFDELCRAELRCRLAGVIALAARQAERSKRTARRPGATAADRELHEADRWLVLVLQAALEQAQGAA
jgi:hypothetical protein